VPKNLSTTDLKPLVCATAPKITQTFAKYKKGAIDGRLYIQKIMEYVEYGATDAPAAERGKKYMERG
jgi:large subunit ribosomal protein L41